MPNHPSSFWFGKSKGAGQYANVGLGRVQGSTLEVEWCDLPLGGDKYAGKRLVLELNEANLEKPR